MFKTTLIPNACGTIGIELEGLIPERLDEPAVRNELWDLFIQHGLIVFRGLETREVQVKLSNVFGKIVEHRAKPKSEANGEVIGIRYTEENGVICDVGGEKLGAWLPWHSDLIYVDQINRGGILRPVTIPSVGGQTGFLDRIQVYDALPDDLKQQIGGLWVLYKWNLDFGEMKFGNPEGARITRWNPFFEEMQSRTPQYPVVAHPMTYKQKETGRTVLNVSPWFAIGIEGMENEEGDALLKKVVDHCIDERFAYYHQYCKGDMVLRDNWRCLHRCPGVPVGAVREMERTTIDGGYALGRIAEADAVIDDRLRVSI
jgi:taurine dioxygenase